MNLNWSDIYFENGWVLYLMPIVVISMIVYLFFHHKGRFPSLRYSDSSPLKGFKNKGKAALLPLLPVLRVLTVVLMLVALARPQKILSDRKVTNEGIDIVLVTDLSLSMLAEDFRPNRLEAAKSIADSFVMQRINDRIGLVVFADEAFTQCPVTSDHAVVRAQLRQLRQGVVGNATAIGMGLSTGVIRLQQSDAKSKVVILLTDGENSAGAIDPSTAVDLALQYGVKVYTIGVGSKQEQVPITVGGVRRYGQYSVDEKLLAYIADQTGGEFFSATNKAALSSIFKQIDQLEKTKIEQTSYTQKEELFHLFLRIAVLLLFIEIVLRYTLLRTFP